MTNFNNLAPELQVQIFSYLTHKDLNDITAVSRDFYHCGNHVWATRLRKDFNVTLPDDAVISPQLYYQKQLLKERDLFVAVETVKWLADLRKKLPNRINGKSSLDEFNKAAIDYCKLITTDPEFIRRKNRLYNQSLINPAKMNKQDFDYTLEHLCYINASHTIVAIYESYPELIDLSKLLKHAIEGLNINLVRTLITLGVDINKEFFILHDFDSITDKYVTPLFFAMLLRYEPIPQFYLNALGGGYAIDNQNLMDIMNLLLQHGANPERHPFEEDYDTHEIIKNEWNCKKFAELECETQDFSTLNPALKETLDKIINWSLKDNLQILPTQTFKK